MTTTICCKQSANAYNIFASEECKEKYDLVESAVPQLCCLLCPILDVYNNWQLQMRSYYCYIRRYLHLLRYLRNIMDRSVTLNL